MNGICTFDPTQGHQFDPGVTILLVSCSTHHPLQVDMPHDHVRRNLIFDPSTPCPTTEA